MTTSTAIDMSRVADLLERAAYLAEARHLSLDEHSPVDLIDTAAREFALVWVGASRQPLMLDTARRYAERACTEAAAAVSDGPEPSARVMLDDWHRPRRERTRAQKSDLLRRAARRARACA